MEIDLFTLIAQVVNFLILLALLQRFLFKPVTGIMEKREQEIADRMNSADKKTEKAEQESAKYEKEREELSKKREEEIKSAREEAEEIKKKARRDAKEEISAMRKQWEESLGRDKEEFLKQLRRDVGRQVCSTGRALLEDLANENLEEQIIATFIDRLEKMNKEDLEKVASNAKSDGDPVTVTTAFEISEDQQRRLNKRIGKALDKELYLQFETKAEVVCGIELQAGGHTLRWSVDDYLGELERRFADRLNSRIEKKEADGASSSDPEKKNAEDKAGEEKNGESEEKGS